MHALTFVFTLSGTVGVIQNVAIGRGWEMPVLMHLNLIMVSERLILEPELLAHCPALQCLELRDSIGSYDVREIQTHQPSKPPELIKVFLSGTPALAFHPDTLHTTLALKTLAFGSPSSISRAFLPSVYDSLGEYPNLDLGADEVPPEYVPRTQWTWDWFLPQPETLDLSIEFALHFQFRMLQGTPSLQELCLMILSTHTPVVRVLTESDFAIVPWAVSASTDETGALVGGPSTTTTSSSERLGTSWPLPIVPSSLSMLPHKELHSLYWHLSGLRAEMEQQVDIERSQQEPEDQQQDVPQPTLFVPPPLLDDAQLVQQRHGHLSRRQDGRAGLYSSRLYSPQQLYDMHLDQLQGMVESRPALQQELESLLAARERYYLKRGKEATRTVKHQAERPDRLVVPSLETLELNGAWHMSDQVLDVLLGQVFVSLEAVDMFRCVGFGTGS